MQQRHDVRMKINRIDMHAPQLLEVSGHLTRSGVFPYESADGTMVKESRPPEEVFKPSSLDTLVGAPVTLLHPKQFVDTKNLPRIGVGWVDSVRRVPPYVDGTLMIFDQQAIRLIEEGELLEVSCGYVADLKPAPITEQYNLIQTNIKYNHAALGPADWARLGVGLHSEFDL